MSFSRQLGQYVFSHGPTRPGQVAGIDEAQALLGADLRGTNELRRCRVRRIGHLVVLVKRRHVPGDVAADADARNCAIRRSSASLSLKPGTTSVTTSSHSPRSWTMRMPLVTCSSVPPRVR